MAKEVSHTHTQPADSLGMEDGEEKNNKNPPWGLFPFCPDTPPDCSCGCGWVSPSSPPTFSPCHKRTGEPKLSGNLYLFFRQHRKSRKQRRKRSFFLRIFLGLGVLYFSFLFILQRETQSTHGWQQPISPIALGSFFSGWSLRRFPPPSILNNHLNAKNPFFFFSLSVFLFSFSHHCSMYTVSLSHFSFIFQKAFFSQSLSLSGCSSFSNLLPS